MATLTVSTNGRGNRQFNGPYGQFGKETTPECHDVKEVDFTRYTGDENEREVAVLAMDTGQAAAIAYDLLFQLVDAGYISGWNVQFPERDEFEPFGRTQRKEA